ncbi:MAG TPA: aspartate carbamoyltransferase [Candidatus Nanoarchaeia archaeon]|nr:aspartate carbamoyltransferase [Candidatus Nanoarchaeia archaeon]
MNFKNRHIISIKDFTKQELLHILKVAEGIQQQGPVLKGKILATLFFEPSTRTRLSFEASMHRLGGNVIGFSDASNTSMRKGESLEDTIKVVSGYCDAVVIRHPEEGSAARAAGASLVPVINAGDGANQHPTQTFLDLFTILKTKGRLDGLSVGFLGDLKYGRTVHSLAHALSLFGAKMYFVSPESLRMPNDQLSELKKRCECIEVADVAEVCGDLDVVYATRIQKERFQFENDFKKVEGSYKLDRSILSQMKPDVKILHPLPKVGEIVHDVDGTDAAVYFQQAHYGIPVRMALLALVLGAV